MSKRKAVEKLILERISFLDKSGTNTKLYEDLFKRLNNVAFDKMMEEIRDKELGICLMAPNGDDRVKLDFRRNLEYLKKINAPIFKRITITKDGVSYSPTVKFPIFRLPVRRASQHITKNFSVHEHSKSRNKLTGQVSGASRSGELTIVEIQILNALGMKSSLKELVGVLGGDAEGSAAHKALLFKRGSVSQNDLKPFIRKTGATATLKSLFKAIHVDINL